jgi:hypothetical protein
MNETTYDANKNVVSIGPGTRSGITYDNIKDDGVVITAGRVAPVGASGFVLGGGISYHWPGHGWGWFVAPKVPALMNDPLTCAQ